jgi:hypothetical protein
MFHTHLIHYALTLLPPLCPMALGKWCMFVFVLEVLEGNGPGSFFSITKKSNRSHGSQHKSGPPGPPLSPFSKKEMKAGKADEQDQAAIWPSALATLPPSLSPLSALTLSLGPGSSHVSPEYVESRTLTLGLPLVPLAPLNPLPSLVTLSQVEDVITISNMVWKLHSHHLLPPSLSSSDSPSSLWMAVDDNKDTLLNKSHPSSFNPWTKSHLTPSITGSPHKWETWLDSALHNGVPEFGLAKSIKMLSMTAMLPLGQVKFAWNRLKMLECISHAVRQPPIPDA